jgi:predicted nucleic acid-binding protein
MSDRSVVDASWALQLIVPGQHTASIQATLVDWQRCGRKLCAPSLWTYEMTSAVCKAIHFALLTETEARRALDLALDMDIELYSPDRVQIDRAYEWTSRLKRANAYDSFYLALAETLGCELWTADRRLHRAVDRPWVRWAGVAGDAD